MTHRLLRNIVISTAFVLTFWSLTGVAAWAFREPNNNKATKIDFK